MSRAITIKELNPGHIDVINIHLYSLKNTIGLCAGRAVDDYDDLIGLLTKIVSKTYGYTKEELIDSINEQFECDD